MVGPCPRHEPQRQGVLWWLRHLCRLVRLSAHLGKLGSRCGRINLSMVALAVRGSQMFEIGDKVANGMLRGVVTGRVSDTEVRVYWNSGSDLHHETLPEKYLALVEKTTPAKRGSK